MLDIMKDRGLAYRLDMFLEDLGEHGYAYAEETAGDYYLTAGRISDDPVEWQVSVRERGEFLGLDDKLLGHVGYRLARPSDGSSRYVIRRREGVLS